VPWTGAPAGTTIGHVHLHVGDLAEAERFYHAALGFDKTTWSYPGALFLAAGGYHHHLGTNTWSPGPSPAADEAQLLEWELVVPDAAAQSHAAQALDAAGYATTPGAHGWVAADPWGTRVRVLGRLPTRNDEQTVPRVADAGSPRGRRGVRLACNR
jgi:catechol 2,3-dioxygenase